MSTERPNEYDRLASTADAVEALGALIAAEEPLDEVLQRIAWTACRAVPDADAVTITVVDGTKPRTAAHTDAQVLALDQAQYESTRGPCLQAAEGRRPLRVVTDLDDDRWPEFLGAARQVGVQASLSVPLIVLPASSEREAELVGSINIYSRRAAAFDPFDEELMRLYTATACQAIANARRWQESRETVAQLEQALTSRSTIDQAKGLIRALNGCSADEAFAVLTELSQRSNIKLHTVAAQLLERVTDRPLE